MRYTKYIVLLALCLTLAACGPKDTTPEASSSLDASASSSQSEADRSAPDVSDLYSTSPVERIPLTPEELADAHSAAYDYYAGTVFEVHALTEIDPREGEITLQVSCSKGGVKQDPDRTISLERQDGVWTVVNEGY